MSKTELVTLGNGAGCALTSAFFDVGVLISNTLISEILIGYMLMVNSSNCIMAVKDTETRDHVIVHLKQGGELKYPPLAALALQSMTTQATAFPLL